jgi:hypothetical protein
MYRRVGGGSVQFRPPARGTGLFAAIGAVGLHGASLTIIHGFGRTIKTRLAKPDWPSMAGIEQIQPADAIWG